MVISKKPNKNSAYASRHQMSLRASCWLTTVAEKEPTTRAVKKFLSSRLIMNSRQLLELAPQAQVLEGRGIQGHFEIQSLTNGFQEVFSTADAMLFHQHTCKTVFKTGHNAVEMSQAFHDIAWFRTLKLTFHRPKPVYKI